MSLALKIEKKYTYCDYISWPDWERWEIIDGNACCMSPSPSTTHQKTVNRFNIILSTHPDVPKKCTLFIAPTDVVLSEYDIVQPDLFIVCDESKITEPNIQGAPDITIEVISPHTSLRDRRGKFELYQRFGVKEYIIVDPIKFFVERFFLNEQAVYGSANIFGPKDVLKLRTFEKVEIPLWKVFEAKPSGIS